MNVINNETVRIRRYGSFIYFVLIIGLLWFALGMAMLPSSKIYKQVLILVVYLPCIYLIFKDFNLIKCFFDFHKFFSVLIIFLIFYIAFFSAFDQDWQSLRHVFIIMLFLSLGVFIPYIVNGKELIKIADVALISISVFSLYTMYVFFIVQGNPITARMWGLWNADHPILGSYYIYFFALASLFLVVEYKRYFHVVTFLCLALYIIFSQSRGAYLGFFVSILLYWLVFNFKSKRGFFCIVLFLICSVGFIMLFKDQIVSRGASYRFDVWLKGVSLAIESFWLGHGVGFEYILPGTPDGAVPYYDSSHNLLIHIWIKLGFIGFLIFSFLWICCLYLCYKFKETFLARFNFILISFSSIAFQFDASKFIEAPRLEWFIIWVPICLTIAVLTINMRQQRLSIS